MSEPRHIVAATGVVIATDGRVLLVKTERAGWEPPGGQIEMGEDLPTGLQREILEEAGVPVEVERLVSVCSNVRSGGEKVIFTFLCKPLHMDVQAHGEAGDAGWFSPEDATRKVTHLGQQARLRDGLSHHGTVTYRIYRTAPYELISERAL